MKAGWELRSREVILWLEEIKCLHTEGEDLAGRHWGVKREENGRSTPLSRGVHRIQYVELSRPSLEAETSLLPEKGTHGCGRAGG